MSQDGLLKRLAEVTDKKLSTLFRKICTLLHSTAVGVHQFEFHYGVGINVLN